MLFSPQTYIAIKNNGYYYILPQCTWVLTMSLLRVSRRLLRPLGRPDGKKSQTETKNTAGKVVKTDHFFTQFLRSRYTVKQLTYVTEQSIHKTLMKLTEAGMTTC